MSANQTVPLSVHEHVPQKSEIPPLNHDQAIKRAKIQFTSLGDIFVFYNQLMNGMEQLGIFLIPLYNVSNQIDLCPAHYHNFPITPYCCTQMASTLYQKLQDTDVTPMEYTAIRYIINRYSELNNGYKVLYAMLELAHPASHEDAVILPPKSEECQDDIHLCAQKFDAWLRYETYANRPNSPREQINLFIRRLSTTFTPAVSCIQRLLDNWNPFDNNTPELLKLNSLPNTIERFLLEETGRTSNTLVITVILPPPQIYPETIIYHPRKTCQYCGANGHPSTSSEFMAKLLHAKIKHIIILSCIAPSTLRRCLLVIIGSHNNLKYICHCLSHLIKPA